MNSTLYPDYHNKAHAYVLAEKANQWARRHSVVVSESENELVYDKCQIGILLIE